MIQYLNTENSFLKTFGGRCLLLLLFCILLRIGGKLDSNVSAFGVGLKYSQGLIAIVAPILSLFLVYGLKIEADNLKQIRRAIIGEFQSNKYKFTNARTMFFFFIFPALCSWFYVVQYYINIIPHDLACATFSRIRHLYDFTLFGTKSRFCIGDVVDDMPWIYNPVQFWLYVAAAIGCTMLCVQLWRDWTKYRSAP